MNVRVPSGELPFSRERKSRMGVDGVSESVVVAVVVGMDEAEGAGFVVVEDVMISVSSSDCVS